MADDSAGSSATKDDDEDLKILESKGFKVGRLLGKGSYSRVLYLGPEPQAVKVISKVRCPKEYLDNFLPNELEIFPSINHENIIRCHEIIESPEVVCVLMEYADSGSLLERLQEEGPLEEEMACRMFRETVRAVQYCHSEGIGHRDLKLDNVLLTKSEGITRAKLSDFGFSIRTKGSKGGMVLCDQFCGSPPYTAPEVLQKNGPYDALKADVWSLGVILYGMLYFRMPFKDSDIPAMIQQQLERSYKFPTFPSVSTECRELMAAMLEPEVDKRLPVDDVVTSKWLTSE